MTPPVPAHRGRYLLISPIGKGGMGEVWKGFDPLLKRDVAVKVAAQQFTDRFEREALATAALNHKNICTLYDVGPDYLVLELVEGPTLAERIAQGPIPLDEALGIAKQIAAGLESAHERPIVHRDLKPANVKIKPDGTVKVLDFGLAKAASEEEEPGPDSPTMAPGTRVGMILGTAGYMSPEQARGQKADKRADIWAFGVVLWEMVTGKQLFGGPTAPDSLAAILTREPDLTLAPERIRRLLSRCLEKDPRSRLRDIGDAMALVDTEPSATAPSRSRLSKAGWVAAGVATAIAAALAFVHFREKPPETPVVRSTILAPEKTTFSGAFNYPTLSPDGRRLMFGAQSADGVSRLWVRALDSMTAQPLAGTEGALSPFWSPDGRSIGFTVGNKLKKIDASGGPAVPLDDLPGSRGASWSTRGVIVFAPAPTGPLQRIPVMGGNATPATALDPARQENTHRWPWFLPDGRHFLYAAIRINTYDATIYVGSLDSRETRIVAQANSNAIYASGYLFFLRDNTLMAQPFDAKRLTTTGETVAVAQQVAISPPARGLFAVSENGTLVFQSGGQGSLTLAWMDRTGKRLGTVGEPGQLLRTALSPDGKRAILSVYDRDARSYDLWIYDLARNLRARFTFDPGNEREGIWSPDGSQIVFSSDRNGHRDLYRKLASGAGAEELLYADGLDKIPTSWSPDGKFVMFQVDAQGFWVLPLEGKRKPALFVGAGLTFALGQFSPDGHWVAYSSSESGRDEIYLAQFPGAGGKRQVSIAGGSTPRWRADGKELFYIGPDNRLMAAEVNIKGVEAEIGAVRPLFGPMLSGNLYQYDVSADGQRILAVMPNEQAASEPLTLVQNWTAALKK